MTLMRKLWDVGSQSAMSLRQLGLAAGSALVTIAAIRSFGFGWATALPTAAAMAAASLVAHLAHRQWQTEQQGDDATIPKAANSTGQELFALLPGLVTRHDCAGQLLAVMGADAREFGFSAHPVLPSGFIDAIHISGRLGYLQAIDALRQGAPSAEVDFLMTLPGADTAFRPVRCRMAAQSQDGAFGGFIAHCQDLGHEQALRDEAEGWKAEARSANDAKTRFLAAVSHELRTPLNAILGFSDILTGEYFGKFENPRQKEYVELINQSGHHLLAVVNTMLDMSKIEAGRYELIKEHFSIGHAIRTVDEMLGLQARSKNVVLATRVARGLDEVVADRRAIQQVLINLANNAIKFTEAGGVVTIDASQSGDDLVLTVSDTGIGIPAEKLAMIGKPFMQVQNDYTRQYEGTGLGLALVKGLVALHGGTFVIASEEGRGTVITVKVPVDGDGEATSDDIDFPPRLTQDRDHAHSTGEYRNGAAEAKIA